MGKQDSFDVTVNEEMVYFNGIEVPRFQGLHDFLPCYHSKVQGLESLLSGAHGRVRS